MNRSPLFLAMLVVLSPLACGGGSDDADDQNDATTGPNDGMGGMGSEPGPEPGPANTDSPEPVVNPGPDTDPMPSVDPEPNAPSGTTITASEANNYSFSSTLSINVTSVAPSSELAFNWVDATKDLIGHDVDPMADVDMVTLLMWSLNQQELELKLNADELLQSDLEAIAMIYTNQMQTSGSLFEMTSFGSELEEDMLLGFLDPERYDPANYTYTLMTVTGTTAGEGTRMIQGFRVDPESDNTTVDVTADSTALDYTVDLTSLTPTAIPAGETAITLDWSGMTTTALGTEFNKPITDALVARYSLDVAELEANFLDLELIADEIFRAEVPSGTTIDFADLTNDAGEAFAGIDDQDTWIVALFCGSCANPAPWYLSVLNPM